MLGTVAPWSKSANAKFAMRRKAMPSIIDFILLILKRRYDSHNAHVQAPKYAGVAFALFAKGMTVCLCLTVRIF
jgi:hypothetical protein